MLKNKESYLLRLDSTSEIFLRTGKITFHSEKNIFHGSEKFLEEWGNTWWTKKLHQKFQLLFFVNYFVCILNLKTILRGKNFECRKFLWKDTRNESFMFSLWSKSYLITSSSSSTLLLDIMIFLSDVSQFLFCFGLYCLKIVNLYE